ncbi:MAG: hypothetical protein ACRD4R_16780 [Candidatus Acidiferrales bacterium]
MDFAYRIFGLLARSDRSLPGLKTTADRIEKSDVSIHFDVSPPPNQGNAALAEEPIFVSSIRTESGEPSLRIWKIKGGALLRLDYFDGTQFWLDGQGREIWARWSDTSSFEDAASYLLGPVFGYLLRLRGITCLHASAVECGGRAAAFLGPEGAGKSTVAAALALRGHAAISDDIVALVEGDGGFYAAPAYPYLSLWPDSVEALYGAAGKFAAFSDNYAKKLFPLAAGDLRFAEKPALLNSIFLLGERSGDPSAPFVEEVEKRDALMSLVGNTYANLLLDEEMRAREFALLGRLVESARVRRLRAHENSSRIGALCGLIERELTSKQNPDPLEPALH